MGGVMSPWKLHGEARAVPAPPPLEARFENDPDTDWTLAANRAWIEDVVPRWHARMPDVIPLQIAGECRAGTREGEGRDPSRPGHLACIGGADIRGATLSNGALSMQA